MDAESKKDIQTVDNGQWQQTVYSRHQTVESRQQKVVVVVVYLASYINLFDKQIGLITVKGFTVLRKWEQKQILSPA